ncbi:UPF0280 family protein [Falsiruegeria mediterranea]|uniref:Uncharacterized protein n=1 Tax=Falsiruegeria mediterranea M17 TaxID=1200281 RepID=A0A2R8C9Z3_9RHOB|nr:UPF0280 family protein [Falsiruegeria mediterranea]SPJ29264.1 hypothetical protein TRM7615_02777 [Falsiruegeria mediterranea M17]
MKPVAAILPCGTRLHLQHGPIDLIIGTDGARKTAFEAAEARFQTVLQELVGELAELRHPMTLDRPRFEGRIARRMARAARPHSLTFVTPMAAVAGSVADEVLNVMRQATPLRRAYVNNGGDIALHLAPGEQFTSAMASVEGQDLGRIEITSRDRIGGIATSGRGGRSLSLGIADSVTVLARTAAQADVAATLIANAVDLPDHPAITRRPASDLQDDSDLGERLVTTHCAPLSRPDIHHALQSGLIVAEKMRDAGLIRAASLHLQGESRHAGPSGLAGQQNKRTLLNA